MGTDPQKAVGLAQVIWRHRWMIFLPGVSKEEGRLYRRLLDMNQRCWEEFEGLRRKNPQSLVLISPFTLKARPLCGQPVTEEQRNELDTQDGLWSYLDNLAKALVAYKWPAAVIANFKLLSYRQNGAMVGLNWMSEFEEHEQRLAAMANKGLLSGLQRKLAVVDAHREAVFDPPDI